jgi:tetratricopeptide (TPR) repeat protein
VSYVRARAAAADGAVDVAAAGYAAALATSPGDEVVAIRAYRNALASGDMVLARRAAAILRKSDVAPADVALIELADAIRAKNAPAIDAVLTRIDAGPLDFLTPVVRAWLAHDRGADPLPILDDVQAGGLSRRYIAEHRALLLIASGKVEPGIAALRVAIASDSSSFDLRWNAALVLAGAGKRDLARTALGGGDPLLESMRAGLRKGPKASAAFGTGRALTRLAADLAGQDTRALSITLTRAALILDPADDRARLLLAEALAGERAFESANALLDAVRRDSPFIAAATAQRIELRRVQGDSAGALALAASLADRSGASVADRQRYADLLAREGREADAAKVYAAALAEAGAEATWVHHLQLGGALDRSGQWEAALPHLRKAVELGPQQAVALNYLGYSLAERGEELAEARDLLERASRLRPDDDAITDSLGWAYFRSGMTEKALPLLESAAQGSPSSATINEHLGDVYWRLGRKYEARYAWRAAALYAEGEQKLRLSGKLSDGLGVRVAAN